MYNEKALNLAVWFQQKITLDQKESVTWYCDFFLPGHSCLPCYGQIAHQIACQTCTVVSVLPEAMDVPSGDQASELT
jgi:hypothetical protein